MEFLTAYFANNERTVAKAIYVDDEGNEVPFVMSAEKGNPQWEKTLEKLSIDEIHENTYAQMKIMEDNYKSQVIAIAKERGMIYDIDQLNSDLHKAIATELFKEFDPQRDKEKLFGLKLQLFEFDKIRNSDNKDLKAQLRKAETMIDAVYVAIQIVKEQD